MKYVYEPRRKKGKRSLAPLIRKWENSQYDMRLCFRGDTPIKTSLREKLAESLSENEKYRKLYEKAKMRNKRTLFLKKEIKRLRKKLSHKSLGIQNRTYKSPAKYGRSFRFRLNQAKTRNCKERYLFFLIMA